MPYVARDNGNIVGVYARPQPGWAEEKLPDDDAEVVTYRKRVVSKPPSPQEIWDVLKQKNLVTDGDLPK